MISSSPGPRSRSTDGCAVYPGEAATFDISLTAPATTGTYTTEWQMLKDDAFGGSFGHVASAQIQVDADPPVITIASPIAADYPYGAVSIQFSAADALSGVASSVVADIDGVPVTQRTDDLPGAR